MFGVSTKGSHWHVPNPRMLLVVLVFVGLLLRLAVAIHIGLNAPPEPGSDAAEYDSYAWNLAQGHGYRGISPDVKSADGKLLEHPSAYRAPGTSTLWAGLYRLTGHRYDVLRIAQCVLGALSILLLYAIGRRCFAENVALLAATMYTFWPTSLQYSTKLASEPLYAFLFCWFILAALRFAERPQWLDAGAAGLLLGLAMLTRSNAVLMVALLFPWVLWQFHGSPKALIRGLAMPLVAVATLIPWTVRNYHVFQSIIPFETGGGDVALGSYNRVVATDPHYYGYWVYPTSELPEYREQIIASNNEVIRNRVELQLALRWTRQHPDKWWYLVRMRFIRSWTPFLESSSSKLYRVGMLASWGPIMFLVAFAFFPTGYGFLRDRHPGWIIHLGIMHFVLTALIFWGASRFRYPVEGLCIILASAAMVWITKQISISYGWVAVPSDRTPLPWDDAGHRTHHVEPPIDVELS
jgi:4-amino-4-deoxy-L-arabinose transferase-like glycosyltransferase